MTKKLRNPKYLSVGAFSKDGDGVLVIISPNKVELPRAGVSNKHILRFKNESWLRNSAASIMKKQTGLESFIKDGKNIPIATGVQRMPAVYSVTNYRETSSSIIIEEQSVFILGRVDPSSLKNPYAFFIKLWDFKEYVKEGKISLSQQFLILRIMSSRDNPNRIEAEKAGRLLKELQRKHP